MQEHTSMVMSMWVLSQLVYVPLATSVLMALMYEACCCALSVRHSRRTLSQGQIPSACIQSWCGFFGGCERVTECRCGYQGEERRKCLDGEKVLHASAKRRASARVQFANSRTMQC